jgi:hypothetical protein
VARARRHWIRGRGMFDPARLVFIDETPANTGMTRPHGRCARGEQLLDHVQQGHWMTITFVAALRRHGMRSKCPSASSRPICVRRRSAQFLAYGAGSAPSRAVSPPAKQLITSGTQAMREIERNLL